MVQGVAPTKEMAEEVCMIATRQMFYARLPQVKGTAGGVAFLLDEVMPASPAFRASGTEPVFRCYIEARSKANLAALRTACAALLKK